VSLPSERRQRRSSAFDARCFDQIDRRILTELQDDGRVTMRSSAACQLSRAVGERGNGSRRAASSPATRPSSTPRDRLSDRCGRPHPAGARQLHKVPEVARATPEVVECHRVTGEDCYIAKLHLRSMDDLEASSTGCGRRQTTTSIVHSAPVEARPLPLLDVPDDG